MNTRKLALTMAIFCLCAGAAWTQKSVTDVYTMDVIVAAPNLSPETTSMLFIYTSPYGVRGSDNITDIYEFDGMSVNWRPSDSNKKLRGVIIPSGMHVLIGRYTREVPNGTPGSKQGGDERGQIFYYFTETAVKSFDFKPGGFYRVARSGNQFTVTDLTNDINWSNEKAQMVQLIQKNSTGQPAQGSTARSGGIQGALDRAAKTVMANLKQDDNIAIISFTAPDKDSAEFV